MLKTNLARLYEIIQQWQEGDKEAPYGDGWGEQAQLTLVFDSAGVDITLQEPVINDAGRISVSTYSIHISDGMLQTTPTENALLYLRAGRSGAIYAAGQE